MTAQGRRDVLRRLREATQQRDDLQRRLRLERNTRAVLDRAIHRVAGSRWRYRSLLRDLDRAVELVAADMGAQAVEEVE